MRQPDLSEEGEVDRDTLVYCVKTEKCNRLVLTFMSEQLQYWV